MNSFNIHQSATFDHGHRHGFFTGATRWKGGGRCEAKSQLNCCHGELCRGSKPTRKLGTFTEVANQHNIGNLRQQTDTTLGTIH